MYMCATEYICAETSSVFCFVKLLKVPVGIYLSTKEYFFSRNKLYLLLTQSTKQCLWLYTYVLQNIYAHLNQIIS